MLHCLPYPQILITAQLWEEDVLLRDDADHASRWSMGTALEGDGTLSPSEKASYNGESSGFPGSKRTNVSIIFLPVGKRLKPIGP